MNIILKFIKSLTWGLVAKTLRWIVALFFASTILAVVAFRFLPVYFTPLMFIRCGEQIGRMELPRMHHTWLSLDEMSQSMPVAVMASEDQRFLIHHGFDLGAIQSAARHNRTSSKKFGASTISQQTAKNVFLWPGRSWVRKGLEAYFTTLIELMWSKQRIMQVYLNSIEMGDGIYGVQAVAERHFGKDAKDLSRAECALIAATLPNPLKMDCSNPSPYMLKRQRSIMTQMKYIPLFPKEGEDYDPNTTIGGVYHKKKK